MSSIGSFSDIVAGRARIVIGADDAELAKGLNAAARRLTDFGEKIRGVGLGIGGAGSALFAPLAGASEAFAEHGENLEQGSKKTGLSVEALSTLQYAAQQSGVGFDVLEGSIAKMNKTLTGADEGSKKAAESLVRLGLAANSFVGLNQEERFKLIAQRISEVQDPAIRAGLAMQIFGKSAAELLPLLGLGAAGITALQDRATQLGLQWSGADAEAAETFKHSLNDLWDVMRRVTEIIGSAVAPVFQRLIAIIIPGVNWFRQFVQAHRELFEIAAIAGVALIGLGGSLVILGTVFSATGVVLSTFAGVISLIATVIGAMLSPIGLVTAAVVGLGAAFFYLTQWGQVTRTYLQGAFQGIKADALQAFDGIKSALMAGDWALAAQILWTTIKLEFAKGVNALSPIYQAMKANLIDAFIQAGFGIRVAWDASVNFVTRAWYEMVAALESLWDGFCDAVSSAWDGVTGLVTKGMNEIHAAWSKITGGSFDAGAANAQVDRENSQNELQRTRDSQSGEANREAELQKKLDAADDAYDAAVKHAQAARDAGLAATDKSATDAAEAAAQKVETLKKQLDELHAQARTEAAASIPGIPDLPKLGDGADALGAAANKIYGQFGGAGASQIGATGGHAQTTAQNTTTIAQKVSEIATHLKSGDLLGAFKALEFS